MWEWSVDSDTWEMKPNKNNNQSNAARCRSCCPASAPTRWLIYLKYIYFRIITTNARITAQLRPGRSRCPMNQSIECVCGKRKRNKMLISMFYVSKIFISLIFTFDVILVKDDLWPSCEQRIEKNHIMASLSHHESSCRYEWAQYVFITVVIAHHHHNIFIIVSLISSDRTYYYYYLEQCVVCGRRASLSSHNILSHTFPLDWT